MSQVLTLYQKVLIVKWYYKNNEQIYKVGALFQESFNFSPIPRVFDHVLKAFELTGSVVEDVIWRIKEEPIADPYQESSPLEQIKEEPELESEYTVTEVHIKEEPILEEEEEASGTTSGTIVSSLAFEETSNSLSSSVECDICHENVLPQDLKNHKRDAHYIECEVCGKRILVTYMKVGMGFIKCI